MLRKLLNARAIVLAATVAGLVYLAIAALVNIKLLVDLNGGSITAETLREAFGRADGAVIPWAISMVVICLIVGAGLSNIPTSADESHRSFHCSGWIPSVDDDTCYRSEWSSDDEFRINPTTGLPMMSGSSHVDVGGNCWCAID